MKEWLGKIMEHLRRWFADESARPTLEVFAITDRGMVRKDNQDSYCSRPERLFMCVADGMGGGSDGALASRWACEALEAAACDGGVLPLAQREAALSAAFADVNQRIRTYAKEHGYRTMGTTAVGIIGEETDGMTAAKSMLAKIFHVGDSRAYRCRYGRLDALTRDHTVGSEMSRALLDGDSEQAKALQSRKNPLSHVLTRALGTELKVRPEWKSIDVQRGDRLLFCSDGVHDLLNEACIRDLLVRASSPRVAAALLESEVRKAGAHDNYTILCVFVK